MPTSPIINGYTLFPHPANWKTRPSWQRAWENEVALAVTGDESRQALRSNPRNSLTWLMNAWSAWELAELDDRILEAKKSGLGCAPYWGRSSVLSVSANAGATSLTLVDNVWGFQTGDYIYLFAPASYPAALQFDLVQITGVAGTVLSLASALSFSYTANTLVWPLIYGEFTCKDMPVETAQRASVQATIRELQSPASAATVTGPAGALVGSGIGYSQVGSNLTVHT